MNRFLTRLQHGVACGQASPLLYLQAAASAVVAIKPSDTTERAASRRPSFRTIAIVAVCRWGGVGAGVGQTGDRYRPEDC